MKADAERLKLDAIAQESLYATSINAAMIRYCFRILQRHLRPARVLEMGPAEGVMTELLRPHVQALTLLEGSSRFCEQLGARFPGTEIVNQLFEEYQPSRTFDTIVLGHVLEHIEDPVATLTRVSTWLADDGIVFAAVPNARSIHRQAAVVMGLLSAEDALNDRDRQHGHRRVFNPEQFRNAFYQAGFEIDIFGGYWLKPVSIGQMEASWTDEMTEAFMQMGERYPDIAGEIYVVARRRRRTAA